MTREEVLKQINELSPFLHGVDLPYGLRTTGKDRGRAGARSDNLIDHLWPRMLKRFGGSLKGKRVLDIACNCGGFSIKAVNSGAAEVIGIDIVEHYVRQADFIRQATDTPNVQFKVASLDDLSVDAYGKFDLVFCFGILYHLENPVGSMRKIASVTNDIMVVDTALTLAKQPQWLMRFPGGPEGQPTTSLWRDKAGVCQFTPSKSAVERLMAFLGFTTEYLEPSGQILQEERYRLGKRGTFIAKRNSAC